MTAVLIRLLPDRSGRVRIHWFERTADGPVQTQANSVQTALGTVKLGGAKGRIACQPARKEVTPSLIGSEWEPCVHSDDPRAVTCPECMGKDGFKAAMQELKDILEPVVEPSQKDGVTLG